MNTNIQNKIPVILLFGPTAVGKTDLLMELFENKAEIVSVDSVQIYRDLDIGSAKPDQAYLEKLPHHLIDIRDIDQEFSVGDFVSLADSTVKNIYDRSLIPVLSGGTAFYFRNFVFGLPPIKADTSASRVELTQRLQEKGLPHLWEELLQVDRDYSETISCNDAQRIVRALEVYHTTGQPLSSFKVSHEPRDLYRYLLIGLERPREELYERINQRVLTMFERGLEGEVRHLFQKGAKREYPGMKAIGYREFFHGDGKFRSGQNVVEEIQRNTRRYAKRQMTFFRSIRDVHWFSPEDRQGITLFIERFLNQL